MFSLLVFLGLAALFVKRVTDLPVHTPTTSEHRSIQQQVKDGELDDVTITRSIVVAMVASLLIWLTPEAAQADASQPASAHDIQVPAAAVGLNSYPVLFLGMDKAMVPVATGIASSDLGTRVTVVLPSGDAGHDQLVDPVSVIPTEAPVPVLAPLMSSPTHVVVCFDYTISGNTFKVLDQLDHLIASSNVASMSLIAPRSATDDKRAMTNSLHLSHTASMGALKAIASRAAPFVRSKLFVLDEISAQGREQLAELIVGNNEKLRSSTGTVLEITAQGIVMDGKQDVTFRETTQKVENIEPVHEKGQSTETSSEQLGIDDSEEPQESSTFLSLILRVFGFVYPCMQTFELILAHEEKRAEEEKARKTNKSNENMENSSSTSDSNKTSGTESVAAVEMREQWYTYWMIYALVCLVDAFFTPTVLQGLLFLPLMAGLAKLGAVPGSADAVLVYAFLLAPAKEIVDKAEKAVIETVGITPKKVPERRPTSYSEDELDASDTGVVEDDGYNQPDVGKLGSKADDEILEASRVEDSAIGAM